MRQTIITITIFILGLAFGVQDKGITQIINPEVNNLDLTIPKSINFQGYLYRDGNPMDTTMNMWFGIYDDPSAGNQLFQQTVNNVTVTKGWFTVSLDNIPNSVFPVGGPTRYLDVKAPSSGPSLSPRISLVSVGYSYHSITADSAEYAKAAPLSRPITPPIYSTEIRDTTIIDTKLKDGAVTMSKINQSGATTGQVIKWTGTAWAPRNDSAGGLPSGPAGGDLTGTYPNPTIANNAVTSAKIFDGTIRGVDIAKPCTLTASVNFPNAVFRVKNTGEGNGIYVDRAGNGIFVDSASWDGFYVTKAGDDGLHVVKAYSDGIQIDSAGATGVYIKRAANFNGFHIEKAHYNGFVVDSAGNDGVYVNSASSDGVAVDSAGVNGLYVRKTNSNGIQIDSAGATGVYIKRAVNFNGFHIEKAHYHGFAVDSAGRNGVYVARAGWDGVAINKADWDGVAVDSAGWYGVYVSSAGVNGLYVRKANSNGIQIDSAGATGVYIKRTGNWNGFHIEKAKACGFVVDSAGLDGLRVVRANYKGVYIIRAGGSGVQVDSASWDGVYVYNAGDNGVFIRSAGDNGVNAWGNVSGGNFGASLPAAVGIFAHAYNNVSTDTAIQAYGRGYATGGWYTGGLKEGKEAPCIISPELNIIANGTTQLNNGKAEISYPDIFKENIRIDIPVRVSLTPKGEPSGILYLNQNDASGFEVKLKGIPDWGKTTDITFDWIAIGTLKEPETSAEAKSDWEKMMREREKRRTSREKINQDR